MHTRVVICSDGKRGHENQSRVLARMLGDEEPLLMLLRESVIDGGVNEAFLRLRLRLGGGRDALTQEAASALVASFLRPEDNNAFRDFAHAYHAAQQEMRLFVVSSGTPPATFNLILSRMMYAESIVSMRPSLLPLRFFDLAVLPAHDLRKAAEAGNIVTALLALGYHDEAGARQQVRELTTQHGLDPEGRYWAIAIGGPSKAVPWAGDRILDDLAALHGLARGMQVRLLVTTSRRTPPHVLGWLEKQYAHSEHVGFYLDASKDSANPLPAFYELSERVFVSADSFSMVSEALNAGHIPVILQVSPAEPPGKIGHGLGRLRSEELIYMREPGEDLADLLAAHPPQRIEINREYHRLAEEIRNKLQFPAVVLE